MKKIIAITLTAILLISLLAGCGGEAAPKTGGAGADPTGTWTGLYTKLVGSETKNNEKFSLELKAGGAGTFHRDDMDYDVTWKLDGENFSMTETFLGAKNEYTGTLQGDNLSIFNGDPKDEFTYNFVFAKGDAAAAAAQEAPAGQSGDIVSRVRGDWNGCVAFRERTGKYADALDDAPCAAIARFAVSDDGSVRAFIGLHVEDTPIKNLTAKFDEDAGCVLVSGEWISVPFENIAFTEANGTLSGVIPIAKEAGSLKMVFNFRRLDDEGWTNEDPGFGASQIAACKGKTFGELASMIGYDFLDYPSADGE